CRPPSAVTVMSSSGSRVTSTRCSGVATPSLRWSTRFVPPPRNEAAGFRATVSTAVATSSARRYSNWITGGFLSVAALRCAARGRHRLAFPPADGPKRCAHRRRARGTSCISVIGCGSDWVSSCAGWGVRRIHGHRSFMDIAAIYLVAALAAGGLALVVKLPPLVGFLVAGFGLNAAGVEQMPGLQTLADLGVTLLLFGIGLNLDLRSLVKARVWATAVAHMGVSVLVALAMLVAIAPLGL